MSSRRIRSSCESACGPGRASRAPISPPRASCGQLYCRQVDSSPPVRTPAPAAAPSPTPCMPTLRDSSLRSRSSRRLSSYFALFERAPRLFCESRERESERDRRDMWYWWRGCDDADDEEAELGAAARFAWEIWRRVSYVQKKFKAKRGWNGDI